MTILREEGCEDSGREVAEEEGVVIVGVALVGAAVVIVKGALERLSGSDVVLAVNEDKVISRSNRVNGI